MLQHITLDSLGSCRNDPVKCSSYCGFGFIATETIDGNAVPVLSVCAVCKCPAASHIKNVSEHLKAPAAAPKLTPVNLTGSDMASVDIKATPNSSGTSGNVDANATKETMYKSRSSATHTASLSHTDPTPTHDTLSFAAMAKKRHESTTLAMANNPVIGGQPFNPAQKSQIAAIISKNGKDTAPPKKRKKAATTTESDSASGTKQSKKTKASSAQDDDSPTVFMIALVSETSIVWSGKFERVSTHQFIALRTARFVREVQVPKSATSFLVIALIEDAFKDLIHPGNWSVLRGESSAGRKGQRTVFKATTLVTNGQLDYEALKFSAYNTQPRDVKSGEYPNLVWIARSRGEPDINVPSVFEPDDKVDDEELGTSDRTLPADDVAAGSSGFSSGEDGHDEPQAGLQDGPQINSATQPLFFPPASDSEASWESSSLPKVPNKATTAHNLPDPFVFATGDQGFGHLSPEFGDFDPGDEFFQGSTNVSDTPDFQQFKFGNHHGPTSPQLFQHGYIHTHGDLGLKRSGGASQMYTPGPLPTPAASTVQSPLCAETSPTPPKTGVFLDNTIPPVFLRLQRLHSNMAVLPTQRPKWFSTGLTSHPSPKFFKDLKALQPVLNAHIKKVVALSEDEKTSAVNGFLIFLDQLLRDLLQPFIELSVSISASSLSSPALEKNFDDTFVVGPGGVGMLLSFLMNLFNMLRALPKDVPLDASGARALNLFRDLPSHLSVLLIHLQTKHHRRLWDADGCHDLIYILHSHGDKLPVGTPQSTLYESFSQINVAESPLKVEHIKFLLATAFGNLSDPMQMRHDAICTGQYGLDGFYSLIIVPVLDDIEYDVDGYSDLLAILVKLCKGLARKTGNTIKSYRPPSEEKHDKGQASGAEKSHRQTRSSKKGPGIPGATLNSKTGYYRRKKSSKRCHEYETDSHDDMTNTDSLESDYYTKVQPNQPDIKFRRQVRHPERVAPDSKPTFTYVPGSSSEEAPKSNWDNFDDISDKYARLGKKPKKTSAYTIPPRHSAAGPHNSARPSAQHPGKRPFPRSAGHPRKPFSSFPKPSSQSSVPKPGSSSNPSSSSKPGPSAFNSSKVVKSRVQEAEELANTHKDPLIKWPHFLSGLLNEFGHPDPNRKPRLTDIFREGIKPTAQWKKIHLVYHIDKNGNQSEEWQKICSVFTPALNLWRERIEGTYVWPKGY
ncbi:uncharacterized protein ARMOST_21553 [Armillaria ostoyae]|uniref:Uncharacterized protein n=1 Tax=Armillaria ostoyae TaxID=47428 RepID=A0A284SAE8_ARMOS|nr:uncharacterized protein ARMOST_21553 [Armillaria ostoyae]